MEVYEFIITDEEARDYHKLSYAIRRLKISDWIRVYINTVVFYIILCGIIYLISADFMVKIWIFTPLMIKICLFLIMMAGFAVIRSKNKQLKNLFEKYYLDSDFHKEVDELHLRDVKVSGLKLLVYYRKKDIND